MQFKQIRLEKDMYREAEARGYSFTEYLATIDGGDHMDHQSDLDVFQQQMAARNLVTAGPRAIQLDAFYEENNRLLFPEWINRQVREGMSLGKNALRLEDIVSVEIDAIRLPDIQKPVLVIILGDLDEHQIVSFRVHAFDGEESSEG